MSRLNGTGAPTRKTIGAIGDIYTDNKTGKRYKCTFAYRSDKDGSFDCEWNELKTNKTQKEEKEKINNVQNEVKEEPKIQESESKDEDSKEEDVIPAPKRTDYSSYSKKNR